MKRGGLAVVLLLAIGLIAASLVALARDAIADALAGHAPAAGPHQDDSGATEGVARPDDAAGPYAVTRVVDGDTVKVDVDGTEQTVRLIGVDTPETVHPDQPVECFGPEASAFTTELVDQQPVWLESDPTQGSTDRYGRTLAYIWTGPDTMLNEQLVAGGYGREYTYDTDYRHADLLRSAQQSARSAGAGLWGACGA